MLPSNKSSGIDWLRVIAIGLLLLYDTAMGDVKYTHNMLGKMLAPMGPKLGYPYLEKARAEIAAMLK